MEKSGLSENWFVAYCHTRATYTPLYSQSVGLPWTDLHRGWGTRGNGGIRYIRARRNLVGVGAVLVEHSRAWNHKTCFSLSAGSVVSAWSAHWLRTNLWGVSHGAMTGESQSPIHRFIFSTPKRNHGLVWFSIPYANHGAGIWIPTFALKSPGFVGKYTIHGASGYGLVGNFSSGDGFLLVGGFHGSLRQGFGRPSSTCCRGSCWKSQAGVREKWMEGNGWTWWDRSVDICWYDLIYCCNDLVYVDMLIVVG